MKRKEHIPLSPAEDLTIERGEFSPRNFRITLPPSVCRRGFVELPYDEVRNALDVLEGWPTMRRLPAEE